MSIRTKIIGVILLTLIIPFIILQYLLIGVINSIVSSISIERLEKNALLTSNMTKAMEGLGEQIIKQKAIDVANQINIYITSHPALTIADLQKDEFFQKIAVQPVGQTGYTALTDVNTLTCYFHVNPKTVNLDLHTLSTKLPGFWQVMSKSYGGYDSEGYYDWLEPDGETIKQKYMYIAVVKNKTADNRQLSVAATTYMDEFSKPIDDIIEKIQLAEKEENIKIEALKNQSVKNSSLVALVLFIIVGLLGVLLARSIYNPIIKLTKASDETGKGNLDIEVKVKSKDEIGRLALTFNKMVNDLKKSREESGDYAKNLEKKVKERTKKLEVRSAELEQMNKIMIGRELKIIELKKEVEELKKGSGKA